MPSSHGRHGHETPGLPATVKESGLRPAPVRDPRVLLRTSRRLPVGTFFAASSLLIAVLALVLTGKGMQALQEAGWLATTPVAFPRIDWLGVFPSQQSLSAQALILTIVIIAFFANRRRAVPST